MLLHHVVQSAQLVCSPLEQFDILNLGDWGFFGYSIIAYNTNAQFFFSFYVCHVGFVFF